MPSIISISKSFVGKKGNVIKIIYCSIVNIIHSISISIIISIPLTMTMTLAPAVLKLPFITVLLLLLLLVGKDPSNALLSTCAASSRRQVLPSPSLSEQQQRTTHTHLCIPHRGRTRITIWIHILPRPVKNWWYCPNCMVSTMIYL